MSEIEQKEASELRMLFQSTMEEIRYLKRLEWTIPNYVLLLFAASVAISKTQSICNATIIAIDIAIAIFASGYLIIIQRDMVSKRRWQNKITPKFEPYSRTIVGNGADSWKDWLFFVPFLILVWIGVFVVWHILQK